MSHRSSSRSAGLTGVLGLFMVVLCAIASYFIMALETVEPGNVGIVFNKSERRVKEALEPGWHFRNPLTTRITEYPVSAQTLEMIRTTEADDSVKVGTADGQSLWADVAVQWSVERDEAADMYTMVRGLGTDYITQNFVRQISRSVMNDIASTYKWDEIHGEKRVEYSGKVRDAITARFDEKHLQLEDFNLRGWHIPDHLITSVNQTQAAAEQIKQRTAELEQARIAAEQERVKAEAAAVTQRAQADANAYSVQTEAESAAKAAEQRAAVTRTEAQAAADATRIQAEAQAEANRRIAESLNQDLIELERVRKWKGDVPTYNTPNAPIPFVEVPQPPP